MRIFFLECYKLNVPFSFLFGKIKAIFSSGEASCGYNTACIITFYFIFFYFFIKYLNFDLNVQEKPPWKQNLFRATGLGFKQAFVALQEQIKSKVK